MTCALTALSLSAWQAAAACQEVGATEGECDAGPPGPKFSTRFSAANLSPPQPPPPPPPPKHACVAHVGVCTRDYRPKCGSDGITYSNPCIARNACQFDTTDGPCPDSRHRFGSGTAADPFRSASGKAPWPPPPPRPSHWPPSRPLHPATSPQLLSKEECLVSECRVADVTLTCGAWFDLHGVNCRRFQDMGCSCQPCCEDMLPPSPSPSHTRARSPPPSPSSLSSLLSSLLVGGVPVGGSGNALGGHYTGSSDPNLMGGWKNQTDIGEASHVYHLVHQSMLGVQSLGETFYPTGDGVVETIETLQVRVRSARVQVVAGKNYQIEAELTPSCNRPSITAELTPPPCRVSLLSLEIYEQAWSSTMRLKVATQRVVAPPKTYNLLFGQTGPADMGLDLMGLASSMAVLQEAAESKGAVLEEAGGSDMPQKSLEYRLPEPCVVGWLVGCTEDNRYPVCGKNGVTYDNGCKADNACQLVGRTDGACSALKASPLTRTALLASIVLVAAGVLFGVASVVRVRAANRAATADQETLRVGPKSDDDAATLAQTPLRIVRVELEQRGTRVPI